jgi:hypothetical protein
MVISLQLQIRVIRSFRGGADDSSLLGYDAMLIGNLLLAFQRNLMPPFSGQSSLFIRPS